MSVDDVIAEVRRIGPELRARAAEVEELGRLTDEHAKLLKGTGVVRLLQPARWGGFEAEPDSVFRAAAEVARHCGASGWVCGVIGVHPWELGLYDERTQEEVWGDDPDTWIASTYMPAGMLTPVEGGFRLSGHWSFSSGCDLAGWLFLGALLPNADDPEAMPAYYHVLVPRSDYRIIDGTWDVTGLRGTGSKDVAVEDVFVPDHRAMTDASIVNGETPGHATASRLYHMPWSAIFPNGITSAMVGIAEGALDAAIDYQRSRFSLAVGTKIPKADHTMAVIGAAAADIATCRSSMVGNLREMWEVVRAGGRVSLDDRARGRACQVRNGWRATRAVDDLFDLCGGGALRLGTPLQRAWRDLHAGLHHVINVPDRSFQSYASILMGGEAREHIV
jgi:alkylation response protein AidB-like acyl-CoA dehydrogenase